MSWYTIDEIDKGLYRISEKKHWEHTNMYYIIGHQKNLLIDAGTGIQPLRPLLEAIDDKPIDLVLTHSHWDHMGNVHEFENVYVHGADMTWLKDGLPIPRPVIEGMIIKDVPLEMTCDFKCPPLSHPNPKDISKLVFENIEIIHTPGHSPGSVCLYDKTRQIMFTGDILYKGTIYCHYESTDPSALYESVKRVASYEIKRLLTGHHNESQRDIIGDLLTIMNGLKIDNKLSHGNGLHCHGDICLQV